MALQEKDQDIRNDVLFVESTKGQLQKLRDDGWDFITVKCSSFCKKHDIEMIMMEEKFVGSRSLR